MAVLAVDIIYMAIGKNLKDISCTLIITVINCKVMALKP